MTSRRQRSKPRSFQATSSAPRQPSAPVSEVRTKRLVVVLGAGADVDYGMPTVATLLSDLAQWTKDEGEVFNDAIRKKLKGLRFTFDKLAGDKTTSLISDLFSGDTDYAKHLGSAAERMKNSDKYASIGEIVSRLCSMGEKNVLEGGTLRDLGVLLDTTADMGEVEPLIEPGSIFLNDRPRAAIRATFLKALVDGPRFSADERAALELFLTSVSNIEQVLSDFFTLFCTGVAAKQKTYLYVVWVLWAFLRSKSSGLVPREQSIYSALPALTGGVITFNYTNFFWGVTSKSVLHFHGHLDQVLRIDDRRTFEPTGLGTASPDELAKFVRGMRLDVSEYPHVDFPAIVPPTSFKPLMSRDQLLVWAEADRLIQAANTILVVGYSFGLADEHFNDLLRSSKARIVVIDPNLDGISARACELLDVSPTALVSRSVGGFDALISKRLTCLRAMASDVSQELLRECLRWGT
jgi:hypothetical protein